MKLFIYGLFFAFIFVGCSSKNYKLFQDSRVYETSKYVDLNKTVSFENKIAPKDRLSIEIVNIYNQNNLGMFQKERNIPSNVTSSSLLNTNTGYLVGSDGRVFLPLLGYVSLAGLTVSEANEKLTDRYRKYLKHPYVKVSILNQRVYVLGEVHKPGMVPVLNETMTIYEAIARSGDFTDYAKRDCIKVLNANDPKKRIKTIDLTRLSSLSSEKIILRPNDIVYVEPRDMKGFNVGVKETLPLLQAISSALSPFATLKYLGD